ncbi:MAG: winged helix-turn-helix transcriptional regulator [Methanosarcinales archaeon]|nr:winged helix-turn-helix transcriptional regulator [Methanosarcinales archaeon]
MRKILNAFAILLLFSPILFGSSAVSDGYIIVESGYDHPIPEGAERHDPEPISFWQLPLWVMILHITGMPVEMLASLKALTYFGCKRIFGYNVLDHEIRSRIYDCIRKNPGVYYSALANETNVNKGTLRYHLTMLKMQKVIVPYKTRGRIHYFLNESTYGEKEKAALAALKNDKHRRIISEILNSERITHEKLAERIGVSAPTINWHIGHLKEQGIVRAEKDGRHTTYCIDCGYAELMHTML